ncbi:hypothetical protein NMG60_11019825 [Bertholletia excelsa]
MRGKARRQSRLVHCISAPIRVLREFYTKKLFDCAVRPGRGAPSAPPHWQPNYQQTPAIVHRRVIRRPLTIFGPLLRKGGCAGRRGEWVRMRSYSFGIGRTRRINEDKPCEFEEEDVMANSCDSMYARARVFWCRRRNLVGISRPKLVRLGKVNGMGESREG